MTRGRASLSRALGALSLLALLAADLGAIGSAPAQAQTPETRTYPNGLVVTVFSDRRLPVVATQLLVRSGTAHEAPAQAGLAALTARGLLLGTATRDASTLLRAIEASGAELSASASYDHSIAELRCHRRDWNRLVELFADVVQSPAYPEREWRSLRERTAAEARQSITDPRRAAGEHVEALVHGSTAYGRPVQGSAASVGALEAEDARTFHARHWVPDNAHLLISGDVAADAVWPTLERLFGSRQGADLPPRVAVPAPAATGPQLRILDADLPTTAVLRLGAAGPSRRSPEYVAVAALHVLLGANRSDSRLARALEARMGMPVPLASAWSLGAGGGTFTLSLEVPIDRARAAVDVYREVAGDLRAAPPDESEMEGVRQALLGAALLTSETPQSRAERWALARLYGQGDDFLETYPERVRALRPQDLQRAALRFLPVDTLAVVAVGQAEPLRSQFAGFATADVRPLGSPSGAVPAVAVPLPQSPIADTPENRTRGRAVVDSALAAHGGADVVQGIETWRGRGSLQIGSGPQAMVAPYAEVHAWPDRWRTEMAGGGTGIVRTLNGATGWTTGAGVLTELDETGVEELRLASLGAPIVLLRKIASSDAVLLHAGRETRRDEPVLVVDWVRPDGGFTRLYFVAETKVLRATEQTERASAGGTAVRVLRIYEDLQANGPIRHPFVLSTYADDLLVSKWTLERLQLGVPVSDETFRPSLR